MAFALRLVMFLRRTFYIVQFLFCVSQRELSTGTRSGLINRTLLVLQEWTGFLRRCHRIRYIETSFVFILVVNVRDFAQDVITLLFCPTQNIMVRDVDVHVLATPCALLANKRFLAHITPRAIQGQGQIYLTANSAGELPCPIYRSTTSLVSIHALSLCQD